MEPKTKDDIFEKHRDKILLENLFDSILSAIVVTSPDGGITKTNSEFSKLFGFTEKEVQGRNLNELIVPSDMKKEAVQIDHATSEGSKEVRNTIRKDKHGRNINVSLLAKGVFIDNVLVANLIIYTDITADVKKQLLRDVLFNISTIAIKQYDLRDIYPTIVKELGKMWDMNNFYIALYNKNENKLSLPFFADEKDNFEDIPTEKTITGYVIKQNRPVLLKVNDLKLLEEEGEIDLIGTPCKVWMGVPLKVEGNIIGVMCLQDYNDEDKFMLDDLNIMDFIANQVAVSIQRKMMLDNMIVARQKAEEAAQSKQIFMSTMSHEIRTPLNEVIGITNLLMQGHPREDQMDFIKTLKFSGNHLLTLVNDVLDYNKMESGKIVFEQTLFNLSDFLEEIMRSYSFRSKAKNLSFDLIKDAKLPLEVIGDQIRLNQILSNLLSNALKFTPHGGIKVSVKELVRTGKQVSIEFTITDTGIGIPKEKHSAIFEGYTQASADTTRQYGGTGLGLAICRKLIELQGGELKLESEPDKGSSFSFTITLGIADETTDKLKPEILENYSGLEGKKILVAEDNKINFFVANKFLAGWGVKVTHAVNGKIAIEKLQSEEFDLVLMDLQMPVMDGIEASKIIRNSDNKKIKDIPIVALTAAIMSENHDKIENLHINDYVLKPFKPNDLFERIKKHVR